MQTCTDEAELSTRPTHSKKAMSEVRRTEISDKLLIEGSDTMMVYTHASSRGYPKRMLTSLADAIAYPAYAQEKVMVNLMRLTFLRMCS